MVQTSNQFIQTPEKGQLTLDPNWSTLNCQVSTNEAGTLVAGQAVTLEDAAGKQLPILAATATTDKIFGFIPHNVKTDGYSALDQVKIARAGDVIFLEAAAAIARGASLEFVVTGNKVQTQTTGSLVGVALDKAAADGDLIKVLLLENEQSVIGSAPVVQVATVTASLAEINAGKDIVAAVVGKSIKVVDYVYQVSGTFTTTTSVDLQDESATVVTAVAVADLGTGAVRTPADGALGAGFGVALTAAEALRIVNTGAAAAGGTSITVTVSYALV